MRLRLRGWGWGWGEGSHGRAEKEVRSKLSSWWFLVRHLEKKVVGTHAHKSDAREGRRSRGDTPPSGRSCRHRDQGYGRTHHGVRNNSKSTLCELIRRTLSRDGMGEARMVGASLGHSGIVQWGEIVTPRVLSLCPVACAGAIGGSPHLIGPVSSNCDRVDSVHEATRIQPETRPVVPKKFAGDQTAITVSRR